MEDKKNVEVEVPEEVGPTLEISSVNDLPIKLTPTGKISHAKTRVYTQRYRKEWESMNEFKEWLTSVANEPTRAFCQFCNRNLHAHRLSLLKHMCTLKHQRAAVHYCKRQSRVLMAVKQESDYSELNYNTDEEMMEEYHQEEVEAFETEFDEEKEDSISQPMTEIVEDNTDDVHVEMLIESEHDESSQDYVIQSIEKINEDLEPQIDKPATTVNQEKNVESVVVTECNNISFDSKRLILVPSADGKSYTMLKGPIITKKGTKYINKHPTEVTSTTVVTSTPKAIVSQDLNKVTTLKNVNSNVKKTPMISTHVLDTSRGMCVSGLQVLLYKLNEGKWGFIHESTTSVDGTCSDFLKKLTPGRYKFHYDVEKYYNAKKIATCFPFIEIVFDVKDPQRTYHIPLLLSPYSYSTHRDTLR